MEKYNLDDYIIRKVDVGNVDSSADTVCKPCVFYNSDGKNKCYFHDHDVIDLYCNNDGKSITSVYKNKLSETLKKL